MGINRQVGSCQGTPLEGKASMRLDFRYTKVRLYFLIPLTCALVSMRLNFLSHAPFHMEKYSDPVVKEVGAKEGKKDLQGTVSPHP